MGTEEFWIPAAMAAVASGASYVNQKQSNQRANDAEVAAIQNQQRIQEQGAGQVQKQVQQIAQDTPTSLAQKATGDYVSQLRKNAAGSTQGGSTTGGTQTSGQSTSSLAPASGASSRYNTQAGQSQQEVQNYGNTYAQEMGAIDAAQRMRTNEGLSMQTLSGNLGLLGAQSATQNFVDQLRAQTAGQQNPWLSLGSSLLRNGANAYAMNAGGAARNPTGKGIQAGNFGYTPTAGGLYA